METKSPDLQIFEKINPKIVDYCPVCTLCFEYCEFAAVHQKDKTKVDETIKETTEEKKPEEQKTTEEQKKPELNKKEKGKDKKPKIKLFLHEKKGRTLTQVSGLEAFELPSKEVSKKLTKRFGCGCGSVTADGFELQGGFNEQLVQFLLEEFEGLLFEGNIEVEEKLDKKHKKKGKPGKEDE